MITEVVDKCFFYTAQETRKNLYEVKKEDYDFGNDRGVLDRQASRVACMVKKSNLVRDAHTGRYRIADGTPKLGERVKYVPPGKPEFDGEYQLAFGTAFKCSALHLLTAAHCVEDTNCNIDDTFLVFGFKMTSQDQCQTDFPEEDVCEISRIVARKYERNEGKWEDWALLELKKPHREGFLPLSYDPVENGEELYILGHPEGLPLKLTSRGKVKINQKRETFECDVNTFGGHSGSPVFSCITGLVVGIVCRGYADYRNLPPPFSGYVAPNVISEELAESRGYEGCQRIAYLDEGKPQEATKRVVNPPQSIKLPPSMHMDFSELHSEWDLHVPNQEGSTLIASPRCFDEPPPEMLYQQGFIMPGCYLFAKLGKASANPRYEYVSNLEYWGKTGPSVKWVGVGEFVLNKFPSFFDMRQREYKVTMIGFYDCHFKLSGPCAVFFGKYTICGKTVPGKMTMIDGMAWRENSITCTTNSLQGEVVLATAAHYDHYGHPDHSRTREYPAEISEPRSVDASCFPPPPKKVLFGFLG